MKIDNHKLRELLTKERPAPSANELRREENVFFVGGNLPERQTIETLFDSYYQSNAALFHLTFGDLESFGNGEILAKGIKKNFNAHLMGRLDYPAPAHLIERAYASGVDIIEIPLTRFDPAGTTDAKGRDERLRSLERARAVFPRWSVASTLVAGEEPPRSTLAGIDALLEMDVVPLVRLSGGARLPDPEACEIFTHLNASLRKRKAAVKPLLPLIYLFTPLVPAAPRGVVRGLIDIIEDRRLLAASDLRRVLRVKEVEQSFESSGL